MKLVVPIASMFLFFTCSFSMQSIQNLGLAVISQVAGTIVDKKGYLVLEVFFCAWLCSKCLNLMYYLGETASPFPNDRGAHRTF